MLFKIVRIRRTPVLFILLLSMKFPALCENRPDYSPLVSSYQNGFAHITIDNNDDFQVRNYHIINGKLH